MAAAATIPGLQSLTVHVEGLQAPAEMSMTDDLLLPLTAAAGGPGSGLKKLALSGGFFFYQQQRSNHGQRQRQRQRQLLANLSQKHRSLRAPANGIRC